MKSSLAQALPTALGISGARAVLLLHAGGGLPRLVARAGDPVDLAQLDAEPTTRHRLPGALGEVVLVAGPSGLADGRREAALALLEAVAGRTLAEQRLAELVDRVDGAQQLANMGDYDWNIATNTSRWSDQLYRIYGHAPQSFAVTYETFLAQIHPDDRDRVRAVHEHAYATGEPYQMIERVVRPDGGVRFLASTGRVVLGPGGVPERMSGTCIDITDRVEAQQARETASAALRDAQLRRRQAMEVNDNVIQGLAAAALAMQGADVDEAAHYLERTLAAARHLMSEWLQPLEGAGDGAACPGGLVRAVASSLEPRRVPPQAAPPAPAAEPPGPGGSCRVLIAEDNADVRVLLRMQLQRLDACDVVGEAADGAEAVQLAGTLQPDIVLLDLSMPTMDGLEALPLIRDAAPDARVVVMSGFAERQMADQALAAGAARYVEKGLRMNMQALIDDVLHAV